MVPRYSRPAMSAIWSSENRFRIWFQIEVFAAEAMGAIGAIPADDARTIRAAYDADVLGEIDVAAIDAIEAVTKHDVIAFLTWAGQKMGPESRWLHQGMTSSDVLDTSLAVQLAQASDILLADLDALLAVLKRRAIEHKLTPTIGRSHGIHAEPVTFGLKLAQAHAEFARNMRLDRRVDVGEGADRARNRARRDLRARRDQPRLAALELGISLGELEPEGGRLGVNAVAAADRRGVLVLDRAALERRQ